MLSFLWLVPALPIFAFILITAFFRKPDKQYNE